MGSIAGLLVVLGTIVVAMPVSIVWVLRKQKRVDQTRAWATVASELKATQGTPDKLEGTFGAHRFLIEVADEGTSPRTRVSLFDGGKIPRELSLGPELRFETRKDVSTGEDAFDKAIRVEGPEDQALAALSDQARDRVRALAAMGVELKEGVLRYTVPGRLDASDAVISSVRSLCGAADALSVPSVVEALRENAKHDRCPEVRARNLEVLARRYPNAAGIEKLIKEASSDPEAAVRIQAAKSLQGGPKARAAALRLGQLFDEREKLSSAQQVEVLELLMSGSSYPEVAGRVEQALKTPSPKLQVAAIAAAARAGDGARLLAHPELAAASDERVGIALAKALAQACGEAGEPTLLKLLGSEAREVKVAAIDALGVAGTVRAVEPLLAHTQGRADGKVKQAGRDAVRAIQSRLGDAAGGRLSVVQGGAAGELSLARGETEEGRVSLAVPETASKPRG